MVQTLQPDRTIKITSHFQYHSELVAQIPQNRAFRFHPERSRARINPH